MKVRHRKGDSYTDRLFQWLQSEERLPITYQRTIKPKVYKVLYDGSPRILKGYRRTSIIEQQIEFFDHWNYADKTAAAPVPFTVDGDYLKSKLGCDWAMFEHINGRHADFSRHRERVQAVRILHQFHRTTKGIAVLSIPKDPLYVKWERRLKQFEETKDVFKEYQKKNAYMEILSCMNTRLKEFSNYDWGELEERAWENHEWLHGDLAHHNFMLDQEKKIKLIDFDLLHTGPRVYDHIQLAQRFLPYVELKRSTLVNYFPHIENREIWWKGVLVPSDLLREWLYGYRQSIRDETSTVRHLRKLEAAWETRKKFVRYAEHML